MEKLGRPGNFYSTQKKGVWGGAADDHDQFSVSCTFLKLLMACKKNNKKIKNWSWACAVSLQCPPFTERLSDALLPGLHPTRTGQTLCQQQCVEQAAEHRATSGEFTVHIASGQCVCLCVCVCAKHRGTLNAGAVNSGKLSFFHFSLSPPF